MFIFFAGLEDEAEVSAAARERKTVFSAVPVSTVPNAAAPIKSRLFMLVYKGKKTTRPLYKTADGLQDISDRILIGTT
ncbi:MAG: hypothetical protein LBT46_10155 [Planctomycetaceae bacterium]|nr:hypothetical protein [Planctomycetaceae bacterium]